MKCEDLMIGDWVQIKDAKYPNPAQVGGVVKKCGTFYVHFPWWDLYVSEKELEPIPLSLEMLEKNGFEGSPTGDLFIERSLWETCALEVLPSEGSWLVRMIDKTNKNICGCNRINLYIKYVHQLQHILKVFGINKEIKL